ncbi:MAG: GAF domain-containing protein [Okeania sp. SIO1H6]|nr:GAF domain-containing protein [Okeania sp. SIO1H6]
MELGDLREQLRHLNEVSQTLMKCDSVEDAVQKALVEVRSKLDVQVASIFLFSNEGVIRRVGINGVDAKGEPIGDNWLSDEHYRPGESFSGKAVPLTGLESAFGEPHYSNNILNEYREMRYGTFYKNKLGNLRCGISVPLNSLNRTFGTLEVLNSKAPDGFTNDDIYWLMLIGTNLTNYISTFKRREKQKLVNHIIENFISLAVIDKNFDLKEVFQFIADALVGILPEFPDIMKFQACIIRLNESEDLEIKAKSYTNEISWNGRKDGSVKAGSQIVGKVYQTNQPCFIVDIDSEIDKFNNKDWIKANNLKSFSCLPLAIKDRCLGTISVYTKYPYYFFDSNKDFLESIAFLTAAIIERVRVFNELRKVRRELRFEKEKVLNASLLVGYDSLLGGFLHQYKNELIDFYQTLEKLSDKSSKNQRDKDSLLQNKLRWITERLSEIKTQFKQNQSVPVEINKLVQDGVRLILSEEEIKVVQTYQDGIPIIYIDEKKIKSVICNLLSNALAAISKSNKKNGQISVITDVIILDRIQYIQVSIEDNGIGIPNENREKIFEQQFTTRKDEGGTGMGLYITREILKDYGGKLFCDSKVGKGTKFFVQIPMKRYMI